MTNVNRESSWVIVTGEFPPDTGGVSDYTRHVAQGLSASGCLVEVWVAGKAAKVEQDENVEVHRTLADFDRARLARLGRSPKRVSRIEAAHSIRAARLPMNKKYR
jgi:hypothetical protein